MSVEAAAGDFTFIIFSVLLFVFVVFTFLCVPETKNLTFEEIANKFCPGDDIEVEVVLEDAAAAATTPPTTAVHCPDNGPEHRRQQEDGAVVTFDLSMVEKQRPEEDDETDDRTDKTTTHTKL